MPRHALLAALPGIVVAAMARTAHAYRPFDATDASVAAHGNLELELGPVGYVRAAHASHFAPSEVLNFGIVPRFELVLQGTEVLPPVRTSSTRLSLVGTGVFVKSVLRQGVLQGTSGPSVALEAGPLLPTINDEPGVGVSADFIISYAWRFSAVHLNVQPARTRSGHADAFVGAIIEGPGAWPVRPVAELFAEREFAYGTTLSALIGLIAPMTPELALDVGCRFAESSDRPVSELRAGFTWAWPVAFRGH